MPGHTVEPNAESERIDLLDCPFCGLPPRVRVLATDETQIECEAETCEAEVSVVADTEEEAVSRWNRRR